MYYYSFTIAGIVLLSIFLRFYKLDDLMMFIGDQGWFYLSARDMVLTGNIPLVGITSSHTWLHQGALWTYMLAPVLWLFNFNPVGGAYLSSFLGVITVLLVYKIGKEVFSEKIGLIASFFYATSPLIIIHSRMAYHTTPIPLFTIILFYSVYKWIKGNLNFFPLIILILAILYNFELATFTLVPIILILLVVGILTKKQWVRGLINKKIALLSLIGFFVPMIPMIIYDFSHDFPQTLKFIIWVFYKIALTLGLYQQLHADSQPETFQAIFQFTTILIKRMIYLENTYNALIVLILSALFLTLVVYRSIRTKLFINAFSILLLFFVIPAFGYIAAKTNSEAYILIFFPVVSFMAAILFNRIISYRLLLIPGLIIMLAIGISNAYSLVSNNYLTKKGYGVPMIDRINIAKQIVRESGGKEYNIVGIGEGSQYESFTMGYEYLAWWLGKPATQKKKEIKFVIEESSNQIILKKREILDKPE